MSSPLKLVAHSGGHWRVEFNVHAMAEHVAYAIKVPGPDLEVYGWGRAPRTWYYMKVGKEVWVYPRGWKEPMP